MKNLKISFFFMPCEIKQLFLCLCFIQSIKSAIFLICVLLTYVLEIVLMTVYKKSVVVAHTAQMQPLLTNLNVSQFVSFSLNRIHILVQLLIRWCAQCEVSLVDILFHKEFNLALVYNMTMVVNSVQHLNQSARPRPMLVKNRSGQASFFSYLPIFLS